jgi:hypothetical protein
MLELGCYFYSLVVPFASEFVNLEYLFKQTAVNFYDAKYSMVTMTVATSSQYFII